MNTERCTKSVEEIGYNRPYQEPDRPVVERVEVKHKNVGLIVSVFIILWIAVTIGTIVIATHEAPFIIKTIAILALMFIQLTTGSIFGFYIDGIIYANK